VIQPFARRGGDIGQMHDLSAANRALTNTTSLDQVARVTVERSAALVGATAALVLLADGLGTMRIRASVGIDPVRMASFERSSGDEVAERFPDLFDVPSESFIAVPLVAGGSVIGLIGVALQHPGNETDEWMLSALADQAAAALESARLGGEVRLEMEARQRASQASTSAKDRALSTLAHDIRSPLGAIDGYCSNLDDDLYGPLSTEQRVAIARVKMSGRHLLSLLETVMEMARLGAGVVTVAATPVRLAEVARDAVDMLRPAAAKKGQSLEIGELADDVVVADAARIRQVLVNLIGNAVKFTPASGRIAVRSTAGIVSGVPCVGLSVEDSGPGIPEAEQAAIFEAYYRTEAAAFAPGVGLGLAISKALVERMGGHLAVESVEGKGATFTIAWPAHQQGTQG
jgi:signal transduction histidine kinase